MEEKTLPVNIVIWIVIVGLFATEFFIHSEGLGFWKIAENVFYGVIIFAFTSIIISMFFPD